MKKENFFKAVSLVALFVVFGCAPQSPLEQKIQARTAVSFEMWKREALTKLEAPERKAFDDAVQELRFRITAKGIASGSDPVDEALRVEIDGKKTRDVILDGLETKLTRLSYDRDEMNRIISSNSRLKTKPGDDDSAAVLSDSRDRQKKARDNLEAEIATVKAQLARLRQPVEKA
ncbi:MAG TPA: hypothetical protein PLN52_03795 [Opitutaceae bacterium]|nr:hypothetical protein [Opitutaceae bacterium]